ncbi:hypothetical protein [Gorillibacterium sp. sgz5001074]|uniref:hypothetical protein n=1 Tax=Gorillibacterium sp. sgz5001074 TaxID=3446695 RepID=UPI003F66FE7B
MSDKIFHETYPAYKKIEAEREKYPTREELSEFINNPSMFYFNVNNKTTIVALIDDCEPNNTTAFLLTVTREYYQFLFIEDNHKIFLVNIFPIGVSFPFDESVALFDIYINPNNKYTLSNNSKIYFVLNTDGAFINYSEAVHCSWGNLKTNEFLWKDFELQYSLGIYHEGDFLFRRYGNLMIIYNFIRN